MNRIIKDVLQERAERARAPYVDAAELIRRGRRRRAARRGVAVAAVAAATAVTAGALVVTDGTDREPTGPATGLSEGPLDLGPLSAAETRDRLTECLSRLGLLTGGIDDAHYKVHLARSMDDFQDPVPAVVATVREEHRYGGQPYLAYCTGFSDSAGPIWRGYPEPDAAHPVVRYDSTFTQGRPWMDTWMIQSFYRVADTVERVEVRVGTKGGPEPWRVTWPHDGFVYWSAWITDNPYSPDDKVWLQWRAYDKNGDLIDPELMPYNGSRLLPMSPPSPTD